MQAKHWHVEWLFPELYSLSEHLAVNKVIVKLNGQVNFKQYIPRRINFSAPKFTSLMTWQATHTAWGLILVKTHIQPATEAVTATNATMCHHTRRVEEVEHNLLMDNFFSFLSLFYDLASLKISYCYTAHPASCHGSFNSKDRALPTVEKAGCDPEPVWQGSKDKR